MTPKTIQRKTPDKIAYVCARCELTEAERRELDDWADTTGYEISFGCLCPSHRQFVPPVPPLQPNEKPAPILERFETQLEIELFLRG